MEKVLDIGCAAGGWMLQDAMKHPERLYVGCDIQPHAYVLDSPAGVYNLLRDFSISRAQHKHCKDKEEYADWQRELSSGISRDSSFRPQDRRYEENLEFIIRILSDLETGRRILSTKVREAVAPGTPYTSFLLMSPELYEFSIKDLMESKMPASFEDHMSQYTERIHWLLADGKKLLFQDRTFDHIEVGTGPIEGFEKLVSEAKRLTKKGGTLVIPQYPEGSMITI